MSYQSIRGFLEANTTASLITGGIPTIFYDNVAHAQPDAEQAYASISITFTDVKRDTIGCPGNDNIGGTITVFIRTPANTGSAPGEQAAFEVLRGWSFCTQVWLRNLDGPRTIATDENGVHQLFTVTAAFYGKLD